MANASKALSGAASGAAAGAAFGPWGAAIGGVGGGLVGLLSGDGGEQDAMAALAANQKLYANVPLPQFSQYNPEAYTPEMANGQTVSEDPALRSAQMSAMNKLAGFADRGLSDIDQEGLLKAREQADQISHSGTQAALQNAQSRGVAGSGLEYALREQAAQGAAGRAQDAGMQTAADTARMRAMYNQAFGQMAGQVRGQDFSQNAHNTDILNQFNAMNTQNRNQAQQWNVGNRNAAQQYNNGLAQQTFGDQMQKAGGQAGANTGMAQGYGAQSAANQSGWNTGIAAAGQVGMGLYGQQQENGRNDKLAAAVSSNKKPLVAGDAGASGLGSEGGSSSNLPEWWG